MISRPKTLFENSTIVKEEQKEAKKEATKEAYQEVVKSDLLEKRKLAELAQRAKRIIYQAKAVWPFDLFPSKIVIHEDKVDVVNKYFFKSREVVSIPIARLQDARVSTSLFFASIALNVEMGHVQVEPITFLRKKEAFCVARLISGLVICQKKKIDTSKIEDVKELRQKLEQIGYAHESDA